VITKSYDWRDDGPDYWRYWQKLWFAPDVGIIKGETKDQSWDGAAFKESIYTGELTSTNVKGELTDEELGRQFVEALKWNTQNLLPITSLLQNYEDGWKNLLYIKKNFLHNPANPLDKLYVTIMLDFDDLAGITPEGRNGWVTCWIDEEFGLALSLDDVFKHYDMRGVPLGIGTLHTKRELNVDDPRRQGKVKLFGLNVLGIQLHAVTADYDGINFYDLECGTYNSGSFDIISLSWNLIRGEIRLKTILSYLVKALKCQPGRVTDFTAFHKCLIDQILFVDSSKNIDLKNESTLWRAFTSSDNPVVDGHRTQIVAVGGGINTDRDPFNVLDNYVPPSQPSQSGLISFGERPSVFYPLKVTFYSDSREQMDYRIIVRDVPDGWVIESIAEDGKPPLYNKDTYLAYNIAPWTSVRTHWHIGTLYSADRHAQVRFDLETRRSGLFWELADSVIVWFEQHQSFVPIDAFQLLLFE
jgi:hypothetical protein